MEHLTMQSPPEFVLSTSMLYCLKDVYEQNEENPCEIFSTAPGTEKMLSKNKWIINQEILSIDKCDRSFKLGMFYTTKSFAICVIFLTAHLI